MSAQEAHSSSFCGRVVAVSCEGPSSAVTLLVVAPSGRSHREVVIAPEDRRLLGSRIEDRYEQQLVCMPPSAQTVTTNRLFVRDASELIVQDTPPASTAFPDGVLRTCDPDVEVPRSIREKKPQYTVDAMRAKIDGTVVLHGIVDRKGAVREIRVVHALAPSLDVAAREAFAQWQFLAARRREEWVEMAVSVQMRFALQY